MYDSLNPYINGVTRLRDLIIHKLEKQKKELDGYLTADFFSIDNFLKNYIELLRTSLPLPNDYGRELITARYHEIGIELAKKRNIENPHLPSSPLIAFHTALKAAKDGVDVALIVGPEGFAYEPYFLDFGIKTVAVNIPESAPGENRSIQIFDNLSELRGKKVLVVEDDIRTGATLQKVLDSLRGINPKELTLYLGQSASFQEIDNVPKDFSKVYVTDPHIDESLLTKEFEEYLKSKGQRVFKNI